MKKLIVFAVISLAVNGCFAAKQMKTVPVNMAKEYSCGPTSDKHAGGFSEKNKSSMHRYLKVKGGFLSVVVKRVNEKPQIVFRHHGVDGSVYNEDINSAE